MALDEIAASIKRRNSRRKPVLIAIEGFGGAGKTTFAEKLNGALGDAYIINMDDFLLKESLINDVSPEKTGFDRARLKRQVLVPATVGQTVRYQKFIWASNSLSEPVTVPAITYLIVEGSSSYHPSIAKYYDYKVWVDSPIELAKRRGHARDGSSENAQHWDLWAANDLRYQTKYHPEQHADFVLDNSTAI